MKKIFPFLLASAFSFAAFAQATAHTPVQTTTPAPDPNAGVLSFTEETFDFGNVPQGIPVTHIFNFTNTGKEPVVLSNVQPSCQCTTPEWPKEPIMPGKSSKITVTYNALHEGVFTKAVTITSNATEPTKVIYIKGTVLTKPADQIMPEKQPTDVVIPK